MTGHVCPACGVPLSPDGRPGPGCGCARAAATAEAEDFNPLRIRPYVNLGAPPVPGGAQAANGDGPSTVRLPTTPGATGAQGASAGVWAGGAPPVPAGAWTDGPPPAGGGGVPAGAWTGGPPPGGGGGVPAGAWTGGHPPVAPAEETMPLFLGDAIHDLTPDGREEAPRRRGPLAVAAAASVAVAAVCAAAFAGGLFDNDDDENLRVLPTVSESAALVSEAPTPSGSLRATRSASVSASASAVTSPSASPARSAPSASAAAAGRSTRPVSAPTRTESATGAISPPPTASVSDGTLQRGDSGPEVVELQNRLAELGLYSGPTNGRYNDKVEQGVAAYQSYQGIEGDPEGVYGPNTRRALEAETDGGGGRRGR